MKTYKILTTTLLLLGLTLHATAQMTIDIHGSVYGGARQANVGKSTVVNIGGDGARVIINAVYGGNDISGEIGSSDAIPSCITEAETNGITEANTFIRTNVETDGGQIFIGKMFGGSNGDYTYESDDQRPEIDKSYLEICGGTIGHIYGGGNNATVRQNVDICIDNTSTVTKHIYQTPDDETSDNLLNDDRLEEMKLNTVQTNLEGDFLIARLFGGNNKANMDIQPSWHLYRGSVRDLYSGGNQGNMTHPKGILLVVDPVGDFAVDNVYGGCRMADVSPNNNFTIISNEYEYTHPANGVTYTFPKFMSSRVLILGGNINNVYGGNDISGDVCGGSAIGIRSSINGDVYGGGNGSYSYTDNSDLENDEQHGDYYYKVKDGTFTGLESVQALTKFRPNAESVYIHIVGTEEHKTFIGGSIYCGGNSTTLRNDRLPVLDAKAELMIGSHVVANRVFMGSNGEKLVSEEVMREFKADGFSQINLEDAAQMEEYMKAVEVDIRPVVSFDDDYVDYSSYFGSFFCGGNVGSMYYDGYVTINFDHNVIIYDKLVGGSNRAHVPALQGVNAAYHGGLIGNATNGKKLELNLKGLKIQPLRTPLVGVDVDRSDGLTVPVIAENVPLVWNTVKKDLEDGKTVPVAWNETWATGSETVSAEVQSTIDRRFQNGNVYGGCYESGHVNGNVEINIEGSIIERTGTHGVFDEVKTDDATGESLYGHTNYEIIQAHSGVILDEQGMDALGTSLNVFGGGYGKDSEIWGSTTVNLKKGYVFQVFGGGELGAVGKKDADTGKYEYNADYSTTVNLHGSYEGVRRGASGDDDGMAEAEFVYGGGFEGPICGNTAVYLGDGRVFNAFAGSCNADILGHAEMYVGLSGSIGADGNPIKGFPYVRDHIYGGNDLGGTIRGHKNFSTSVSSSDVLANVYKADVLDASAYVEYRQGHVVNIFGGCYGVYNYTDGGRYAQRVNEKGTGLPFIDNAFVNFRPDNHKRNEVAMVFGAGEGLAGYRDGDKMQNRSYVLVDIAEDSQTDLLATTEFFGAGENNGLGMGFTQSDTEADDFDLDKASAVIDLMRGTLKAAYGGSFAEGVTRRTVVNVPTGSTVKINNIFGGAFGEDNSKVCDVYEAQVNYKGEGAFVLGGAVYGGNNNARRTLYGKVNINATVHSSLTNPAYHANVFGGGYGADTWSQYTEVNMNLNGVGYYVYGGGNAGRVLNELSLERWQRELETAGKVLPLDLGNGYTDRFLESSLAKQARYDGGKYNTNVHVHQGGRISGYGFGGGLGSEAVVSGQAYFDVLGGTVTKDISGSGQKGDVKVLYRPKAGDEEFVATTTVYVESGTVRNVYGSGYRGGVGRHDGPITTIATSDAPDIEGISQVIIGKKDGTGFLDGIPAITRNVYGGGEGGPVFGTTKVIINNGYIGYEYKGANPAVFNAEDYVEMLDDSEVGDNKLDKAGNVFGGGYISDSYVDKTQVWMYGGVVRGGLYGGGEVGSIGRGSANSSWPAAPFTNDKAKIYKGGETHIYMYGGHVMRDVFGGGRGYDNWDGDGRMFMTDQEIENADFESKGFVFGSTDVNIYGGEIGTEAGALHGYGNVFGGGNEGFVYSATGTKKGSKDTHTLENGIPTDGGGYYYVDGDITKDLTLDCQVKVEAACKVTEDFEGYKVGDYVPLSYLQTLQNKTADQVKWEKLDLTGIFIRNAVFAGGNVMSGSTNFSANSVTVFGNAGVSINDVYHRDLISIGTDDNGGLYGDGNLTLVDGFREIHVENYGTDYYSLDPNMEVDAYRQLSERERAYYQLKYVSSTTHTYKYYESKELHSNVSDSQITYRKGQKITVDAYNGLSDEEKSHWTQGSKTFEKDDQIEEDEYNLMDEIEKENWTLWGVCSKYAGRPMNTVQRADMCAVFGSRLVLKGAQDRVPQVVDYNSYTINRVYELSLNQSRSVIASDLELNDGASEGSEDYKHVDQAIHGNYFGIYSNVHFLGNLTSDVFFNEQEDIRRTDVQTSSDNVADGTTTYYNWKANKPKDKNRNNGISFNKVALASGVYLEIKREEGEKTGKDVWGDITGVIELDLINVTQGMGGGYVYARNEHGAKTHHSEWAKVTMLDRNKDARTYRRYTYDENNLKEIETSGNFVHNTKQIVDDCYPNGGSYNDGYVKSPAHYWYIKGSIYVYDQYINAYTGVANAYAEKIDIPLTISAAAHGKIKMTLVQPNYYAYYDKNGKVLGSEGAEKDFMANNVSYALNDPINYWDYSILTEGEKTKFVTETYTTIADCTLEKTTGDVVTYQKGYTLLPSDYVALKNSVKTKKLNANDAEAVPYVHKTDENKDVAFDFVFRPSNNLGHETGYVLTFDMNNPMVWDNYYTKTLNISQAARLNTEQYNDEANKQNRGDYTEGPTYSPKASGFYGQHDFKKGDIINGNMVKSYTASEGYLTEADREKQASITRSYVVTDVISVKDEHGNEVRVLNPGTPVAHTSDYTEAQWSAIESSGKIQPARVCTKELSFSQDDFVYVGKILSPADSITLVKKIMERDQVEEAVAVVELQAHIADAYYCTQPGRYGGAYYDKDKAYRALDTFNSMSKADRDEFNYNFDAFDLLVDPDYGNRIESNMLKYDGSLNPRIYSETQSVDYRAEYTGGETSFTNKDGDTVTMTPSTAENDWWSRVEFEKIPNEKHHYASIIVKQPGEYYVVKTEFLRGDVPYSVGQTIDASVFQSLTDNQKQNIETINFTESQTKKKDGSTEYENSYYYYCREDYEVGEKGEGHPVKPINSVGDVTEGSTIGTGSTVPKGVIIDETEYKALPNYQQHFVIHGMSPTISSTLYVSNESDVYDLSKEKILTVVYLYEYEESDASGQNVTPVSERHVVNIHIKFRSGVPTIGEVSPPDIVIPGTTVGLTTPGYTEGAYTISKFGWEMFSTQGDADTHTNGAAFVSNETPLYWYQDGYYLAYYAETYLGKTYSNAVQFRVANYHDLKKVLDDKEHHYHIDHKETKRSPKIYINDYGDENGLDMLKSLYDLSVNEGSLEGHAPLADAVEQLNNLEFFLRTDIDHPAPWTPIGSPGKCFEGTLHGDGHYISGLDHSLFGSLCGNVYNLGVKGSFTSAGVADEGDGFVENCWVMSSQSKMDDGVQAVFGKPTASEENCKQLVNSYYLDTNAYSKDVNKGHGLARPMPLSAFYNGEVAYNLNGFYLAKRYYDNSSWTGTKQSYKYFVKDGEGTLPADPSVGNYPSTFAYYPLKNENEKGGYVESRFNDGDFIYAGGVIPESDDVRLRVETATGDRYYPIWPDDYIFFGQALNYDQMDGLSHQDVPSSIAKNNGWLLTDESGNRVYRAPAYFRSKDMQVAYFNPYAIFTQTKKNNADVVAHKGMTAIDFTGYNDKPYQLEMPDGVFYPPLLDDDGITAFRNIDLTQNLLVYTKTTDGGKTAADKTNSVVATALPDLAYAELDNAAKPAKYRAVMNVSTANIKGHRIVQTADGYTTQNDHMLVDYQDFNAPISYTMGSGKRMWHQRMPATYVDMTKGWESISLPFAAELVTTQEKGELTHFYEGSDKGHEYWLREYRKMTIDGDEATAGMYYPEAGSEDKEVGNTFLWDYYYVGSHSQTDKNTDVYRQYYNDSRTYSGYPLLAKAHPYIIGFPGTTYYEFDLSGEFRPSNTAQPVPDQLNKQVVTFASKPGVTIDVSDTEQESIDVSDTEQESGAEGPYNGYYFKPNYLSIDVPVNGYVLAADGGSYVKVTSETAAASKRLMPFRAYFQADQKVVKAPARSIMFNSFSSQLGDEHQEANEDIAESVDIRSGKHKVVVISNLHAEADVHVYNVSGQTVASFTIQPGETIETDIPVAGVYIVRAANGRYTKKLKL